MKKFLFSVIALAMSMVVFSTEKAHVQIRLTGVTGLQTDAVNLIEDDVHTSAFEPGVDIEKTMSQANGKSVLVYGIVDKHRCSDVVSDNLDGLKLGFATNQVDTDYKLTFTNVSGRALKLFDRVTGSLVDITNNGEYAFSVDAKMVGFNLIHDRFQIGEPAPELCFSYNTLDVYGYAGKSLVIKDVATNTEIAKEASLSSCYYSKDLRAYTGRLVVTLDGKEHQIDVAPEVTSVHPVSAKAKAAHSPELAPPVVVGDLESHFDATILSGQTFLFRCRPLKDAGEYRDTIARVSGADSILVLTLKVLPVGKDTVEGCEPVNFKGKNYFVDTEVNDTIAGGAASGCDSVTIVTIIVLHKATGMDALEGCDSVIFKGKKYIESVVVYDTIVGGAANGCDSIVNVEIIVKHPVIHTETIDGCDSVIFDNTKYTADTVIKDTIPGGAANGCDSIVNITIAIHHAATGTQTIDGCDSVIFKGIKYTENATVLDTLETVHGCDSIVTVTITINEKVFGKDTIEGCNSVTFKGKTYTSDDFARDTLTAANGCDSIVTVNIFVKPSALGKDSITDCDSVIFKGKKYFDSIIVPDTIEGGAANGCDSIVNVVITVKKSTKSDTTAVECDQFIWYEHTITTSGEYQHKFTNAVGCDSIVTLHATINKSTSSTMEPVSECKEYYWESADTLITKSGTYTHVFETEGNCDSIVSLKATIGYPDTATFTLVHKFGNRLLMINRNEINSLWENFPLDSLEGDHPDYVAWYQIDLAGDTSKVGNGYSYSLESGDPLPAGYTYYAGVTIPASEGNCGAEGQTKPYTIPASASAPGLVPSLARPGEDIKVINLNPEVETTIRIFTTEGLLQRTYTVSGKEFFTIKAAYNQGFYIVEVSADNMKSTLRYVVQ